MRDGAPTTRAARTSVLIGLGLLAALWAIPLISEAAVEGPCDGSATIDGITYTPANDSPSNPIVIPDKEGLVAEWEGSTENPITNYKGSISVVVGPTSVKIADWSGSNYQEITSQQGSYDLDEIDMIPPGLWEVHAEHSGEGGTCSGNVMVRVEGNPLSQLPGQIAAGGTILALIGLVLAGKA